MILELFQTTIKEYRRFLLQLPLEKSNHLTDSYTESRYVAVQVRLILLRKYVSKGEKNNCYIENLLDAALLFFPQETIFLKCIRTRFQQVENEFFEQILADGTKLNLYKSIEDVMYGLYLHADKEKVVRLSRTSEPLRFFCTTKYVEEIEEIVLELNDFLKKMNVIDIVEETHLKAPVISFETHGLSGQDIEHSPYWSNMYARDATNDEMQALTQKLSKNELLILFLANFFIDELKKENPSIGILKSIVLESTIEQWKDFSEARSFCKSIPDLGISNKVRFNNQKDVAYVHIFPNVKAAFAISTPHVVSSAYILTLVSDNSEVPWKIFSFCGNIDTHENDIL